MERGRSVLLFCLLPVVSSPSPFCGKKEPLGEYFMNRARIVMCRYLSTRRRRRPDCNTMDLELVYCVTFGVQFTGRI